MFADCKTQGARNEACISVKADACSVLKQLQHVGTVVLKDLILQSSFDTTQEIWIALQFLVSLTFIMSELMDRLCQKIRGTLQAFSYPRRRA
jgi:hypothetical protein